MKSVKDLKNIRGKRVLVRVDFNVHIERAVIGDDTKIVAAVPTIEFLIKKGAKVILMTHLGRPTAKKELGIRNHELGIVVKRLDELLKKKVEIMESWNFAEIGDRVEKMKAGDLLMLPNLRLHPGEEKNSGAFARELAVLGDVYVNEAFAVSHRGHASLVGVPKLLPAYAGLTLIKEMETLGRVIRNPERPLVVLMGGGKVTDKIAMINTMLKRADALLLGGALMNHFFKAKGIDVGGSKLEAEGVRLAKRLLKNKKIILPCDVVVGTDDGAIVRVVDITKGTKVICDRSYAIRDIGPKTILAFSQYIKTARMLVWNGPMGFYEVKRFSHGTIALGRLFAARSRGAAFGVIGGGETIDAVRQTGMIEYIDFVSTGGGAMLEFLGGKKLPGIEALKVSPS